MATMHEGKQPGLPSRRRIPTVQPTPRNINVRTTASKNTRKSLPSHGDNDSVKSKGEALKQNKTPNGQKQLPQKTAAYPKPLEMKGSSPQKVPVQQRVDKPRSNRVVSKLRDNHNAQDDVDPTVQFIKHQAAQNHQQNRHHNPLSSHGDNDSVKSESEALKQNKPPNGQQQLPQKTAANPKPLETKGSSLQNVPMQPLVDKPRSNNAVSKLRVNNIAEEDTDLIFQFPRHQAAQNLHQK